MTWGAVGSAAIGAGASYLGGSGGGEKTRPMDAIPEFLRGDYQQLAGQIAGMKAPEYYQGQLVADQNQMMQGALGGMNAWGQEGGVGNNAMNAMMGGAEGLMGAGQMGMDYLQGMQERGPNQFEYDQGTYDQAFGNLSGGMQSAFDQGAQQMQQGFDWGQLPGLNMNAALGGAQGSSKQYQQGALGQAMTNQNIQNFGTNMWQNAANQANSNAMSAGSQNLAGANAFDQNTVSNYGNMQQLGNQMMGAGFDMGVQNLGMGLDAGRIQQGYDQSVINADKAKWDWEQAAPMNHLQNQLNLMPGPGGYSPGSPGANGFDLAMQGAQAGLGIYGAGKDAGWWGGGQSNGDFMNQTIGHDVDIDWANAWG